MKSNGNSNQSESPDTRTRHSPRNTNNRMILDDVFNLSVQSN